VDVSNIFREIRIMASKLSIGRFSVLALIGLIIAIGYLCGNLPLEKLL